MPIRIRYKNDPAQECTIRPTPFVSISTNVLKNAAGDPFGVNYSINLTGTIIADEGSPYTVDNVASLGNAFGNRIDFGPVATEPNKKGPYGKHTQEESPNPQNKPTNTLLWSSLSEMEEDHLMTVAAVPYRDPTGNSSSSEIIKRRNCEQKNSNFSSTNSWKKRWIRTKS